ncbi:MAG: hypothetical protein M3O70_19930 [Actinomycetota bacterium]|nr:hypothetical protein [Actinomycetota bacterium]
MTCEAIADLVRWFGLAVGLIGLWFTDQRITNAIGVLQRTLTGLHHRRTLADDVPVGDHLAASGTARRGGDARVLSVSERFAEMEQSLREVDEGCQKAYAKERCEREQAIRDLEGLVGRVTAVPWWQRFGLALIGFGFVTTVIPAELAGLFC